MNLLEQGDAFGTRRKLGRKSYFTVIPRYLENTKAQKKCDVSTEWLLQ